MTRTVTRHTEAILIAGLHGQAVMWTQAEPHGGTAAVGGLRVFTVIRPPGHDDEEITGMVEDADDDEPMPPLVDDDMTDDDSPMPALIPPNDTPVPIWHGPTMMWHGPDAAPGLTMMHFLGPSGGPCRSPAWGFAKPGRQG